MLTRPDGDPARAATVSPGTYTFRGGRAGGGIADQEGSARGPTPGGDLPESYDVVWWDPHLLALDAPSPFGLRRDDLISRDGDPAALASRLDAYRRWEAARAETIARASTPALVPVPVTQMPGDRQAAIATPDGAADVEVLDVSRAAGRPFGPGFGTLVHAILATVPLDADGGIVKRVAETQGRILLGFGEGVEEEVYAAAEVVSAVLGHRIFDSVREADAAGRCFREWPFIWQSPDGTIVEGTVDLAFEEAGGAAQLIVLDFKTGGELDADTLRYRRQLAIYCRALSALYGVPARGILMRI